MPKKKFKLNISPNKIKTILLSIIIAVVLFSFVVYLIQAIKPAPKYEDFCEERAIARAMAKPLNNLNLSDEELQEQTLFKECQERYEESRDSYNLIVFIIAVLAGLLAVSAGILLQLPSVSSGLMIGGVALTIYGTSRYWSKLSNWFRVIVLALVLAVLIWLGYKKLKN